MSAIRPALLLPLLAAALALSSPAAAAPLGFTDPGEETTGEQSREVEPPAQEDGPSLPSPTMIHLASELGIGAEVLLHRASEEYILAFGPLWERQPQAVYDLMTLAVWTWNEMGRERQYGHLDSLTAKQRLIFMTNIGNWSNTFVAFPDGPPAETPAPEELPTPPTP